MDFGFSSATGTDFFNGPAGTVQDPSASSYDATALGLLGVDEAVFDFYVSSTFQLQNLEVGRSCRLTFFGSHKFNNDDVTRYSIYSDDTFTQEVTGVDPLVGNGAQHNQDEFAVLENLQPDTNGNLYVGFRGANGGNGYLNALKVEVVNESLLEDVTVRGTQQADEIFVSQVGNQIAVMVNGVSGGVFDLQNVNRVEIFGYGGGDTIEVDAAVETFISGGFGADKIFGGLLENEIQGGPGPDLIFGGPRADDINAGRGRDIVNALAGDDTVIGGDADDILFGGQGNDDMFGGLGADMLCGGPGDDLMAGNVGADEMHGGEGDDFLTGQGGSDELFGGQGADVLTGGQEFDVFHGGPGIDNALDKGEVEISIEG